MRASPSGQTQEVPELSVRGWHLAARGHRQRGSRRDTRDGPTQLYNIDNIKKTDRVRYRLKSNLRIKLTRQHNFTGPVKDYKSKTYINHCLTVILKQNRTAQMTHPINNITFAMSLFTFVSVVSDVRDASVISGQHWSMTSKRWPGGEHKYRKQYTALAERLQ